MSLFLAIDVGTESARAAVFTDDGHTVGEGQRGYATRFPQPGWAEQDPLEWWNSAAQACRQALTAAGTTTVDAVSVATTASSVVFLDVHGSPVHPAILWMDSRSVLESQKTAKTEHPALAFSGGSDSSEWLVPKAMWFAKNRPELYRDSRYIGESVDYLTYRLTGEWVGSRLNATCKWNYDHRIGELPVDLYEALGVPDLHTKLPSRIQEVGAPVAPLSDAAAQDLGLTNRPIVGTGGIDAHLSLLPLRGISANPVSIVAGTSNAFVAEADEPSFSPTIWGPYPGALTEGRWLIEGGQVSAGSSLTWLAEKIVGQKRENIAQFVAEASRIAPASHGLLMIDNLMGNRTPYRDPELRGAFLGLTLGTTAAALYRAAVEGVAFGTRQVLESFATVGVDTTDVFMTGGIRHNPLWLHTTADALGRPITLVTNSNMTLSACAAIGAVAAGVEKDLAAAAKLFPVGTRVIEPSPESTTALSDSYALYVEATAVTAGIHHRLSQLATAAARRNGAES
ncbi:FGGY family carbohydrate kinase [Klugiella xanthotipulae]|uniref:FGGY-family pentulose kinase n=1 Tax=Klugiella xanthotipulae TaxID=244735 RepID=A0A543HXN3_9MICO|nr:FGGY-family carbohydrate kinase [Klugiella xanthotipulae]TQM63118.1 FGGY-family pentulose kinase [Klugiella xanthotipulae]